MPFQDPTSTSRKAAPRRPSARRMGRLPLALAAIAFFASFAACAVSTEETSDIEQHDRIKPEDDESLGFLLVNLPQADKPVEDFSITFELERKINDDYTPEHRPVELEIGTPNRLKARTGHVRLCWKTAAASCLFQQYVGKFTIEKKKTTSIDLSLVTLKYATALTQPAPSDLGPVPALAMPTVRVHWPGHSMIENERVPHAFSSAWDGSGAMYAPVAPGDFLFESGPWSNDFYKNAPRLQVNPGTVHTIDIPRAHPEIPLAATYEIVPPVRELPDAFDRGVTNPGPPRYAFLLTASDYEPVYETGPQVDDAWAQNWQGTNYYVRLPNGAGYKDGGRRVENMKIVSRDTTTRTTIYSTTKGGRYELMVNEWFSIPLTPRFDAGKTKRIQLRRIDVDDVRITTESGETKMVRGSFHVEVPKGNGWERVGRFAVGTNQGIDVPPGRYRVVIDYMTDEGLKSQSHDLDLR